MTRVAPHPDIAFGIDIHGTRLAYAEPVGRREATGHGFTVRLPGDDFRFAFRLRVDTTLFAFPDPSRAARVVDRHIAAAVAQADRAELGVGRDRREGDRRA